MNQTETPSTLQEVEAIAAGHGLIITPADRAKIAQVMRAEQDAQAALEQAEQPRTFADKFYEFYPRLLDAMLAAGEVVLTFVQTLILSAGIPLALAGLLIVEHHRVKDGILLFDSNEFFAGVAAAVLVAANLILEMLAHHAEHSAGYVADRSQAWSLRIALANLRYRVGIGQSWQPRQLSPAARFNALLRLVTVTILALALAGSMRSVIAQTDGTWTEALVSIVTESNLSLMVTWLGGLLFAAAAVLTAQGLTRYVAIRVVEIVATMRSRSAATPQTASAAAVERAGAMAALAIINAKLEKKRPAPAAPEQPARPFEPEFQIQPVPNRTPAYMNGNGNGHANGDGA